MIGAILGDIIGSSYEFDRGNKSKDFPLFSRKSTYTDDTVMIFTFPSGRRLAYVKPRMGENQFGGEAVTYEGVGATKKWERLESYGPKD